MARVAVVLKETNFGYWVLYTDMEKDAFTALEDYRDRNFIEAGFDDLKGSLMPKDSESTMTNQCMEGSSSGSVPRFSGQESLGSTKRPESMLHPLMLCSGE